MKKKIGHLVTYGTIIFFLDNLLITFRHYFAKYKFLTSLIRGNFFSSVLCGWFCKRSGYRTLKAIVSWLVGWLIRVSLASDVLPSKELSLYTRENWGFRIAELT